jgi:hypothetical protein
VSEAFDSETSELMARALSHAIKQVEAGGQLDGGKERLEALLTKAIMEAVQRGERDEFKLAAVALSQYQQSGARPV